ncbi:hypothetical protein [Halobacterium jilantaiense]|uniref:Matrixin n=1 Tax=Halobacterium jilantaiense TaxID=355548 RepID=A0A1I0PB39_9EURY|nr:hypothetical protein [Halobacterium jilantaiense]SEW11341.1 hypothetical protein SAMN04487945_1538 [Halobacterium jilantaiense]
MARAVAVVAVLVAVLTAGCLTGPPAAPEPVSNPGVDLPYDDRTVSEPQSSAYDNPWRTDEVVVTVDHRAGERNVVPDVMRTVQYWEDTAGENAAYEPDYRVLSEYAEPNVRVAVVRTVEGCGAHGDEVALGCTRVLDEDSRMAKPVTVQVRAGHSPNTTETILKHEFGHTLGYEHGDAPVDSDGTVMTKNLSAQMPADVVDASNRTYPWASETLSVAVAEDDSLRDAQRERLEAAARFISGGADGALSDPPSVAVTDSATDADVVVDFEENATCSGDGGVPATSCVDWAGPDVDDDGTPEYYTDARVVVGQTGHEKPGWHVGYWLGDTLWTDRVPAPFYGWDRPAATTW